MYYYYNNGRRVCPRPQQINNKTPMVVTGGGGGGGGGGGCDAAGAARVCGAPVAERPVGGHCSKRLQGRFDYTRSRRDLAMPLLCTAAAAAATATGPERIHNTYLRRR